MREASSLPSLKELDTSAQGILWLWPQPHELWLMLNCQLAHRFHIPLPSIEPSMSCGPLRKAISEIHFRVSENGKLCSVCYFVWEKWLDSHVREC